MTNTLPFFYLDGIIHPTRNASVRTLDRLSMYGEGCFDTMRSYHGGFLMLEEHLKRLKKGMAYLGIETPDVLTDLDKFRELLRLFLVSNQAMKENLRVRVQVWANDATTGYKPGCREARILVNGLKITGNDSNKKSAASREQDTPDGPPLDGKAPIRLVTSRYRRIPAKALPSDVKWTNGINYILAAEEAVKKQADDALMLDIYGHVSETTVANLFWKKDMTVYTPSIECDILPGITRAFLITFLRRMGYTVETDKFLPDQIKDAEMVWVTNSVQELLPVQQLDEDTISMDMPFWQKMCDGFDRIKKKHLDQVC